MCESWVLGCVWSKRGRALSNADFPVCNLPCVFLPTFARAPVFTPPRTRAGKPLTWETLLYQFSVLDAANGLLNDRCVGKWVGWRVI